MPANSPAFTGYRTDTDPNLGCADIARDVFRTVFTILMTFSQTNNSESAHRFIQAPH